MRLDPDASLRSTGTVTPWSERHPSSSALDLVRRLASTGLTRAIGSSSSRVHDEHPLEHPDLVGGEADAGRVLHQRLHAPDELVELAVEVLDFAGAHAQHRIPVLADLGQREPPRAPRAGDRAGSSLVLAVSFVHGLSVGNVRGLRVDVHDRGQAGLCASPERPPRAAAPARRATARGRSVFGDELRAVAAAQAQERRRAEELAGDPEALLQLLERLLSAGAGSGPGDDDPDEVAERRVAELAPALELLGQEARDVVARRERDRRARRAGRSGRARGPARRGRCGRRAG